MLTNLTIGFVGGGNMTEAILAGLLETKAAASAQIRVSGPRQPRLTQLAAKYGIETTLDNIALAVWADILILGVKPQILPSVLSELQSTKLDSTLIISVAAGVTISQIESGLGGEARVIRAMPNTPALVGAGATGLALGNLATEEDADLATKIFSKVGMCERVSEAQLEAVTGVSGSGPAYMFIAIEAMADAGVKLGLPRSIAQKLAAQTLYGAAKMALDTGHHPAQLKEMVTSPGGTTIAGIHELERGGFRATLMNAVEASAQRANALGRTE